MLTAGLNCTWTNSYVGVGSIIKVLAKIISAAIVDECFIALIYCFRVWGFFTLCCIISLDCLAFHVVLSLQFCRIQSKFLLNILTIYLSISLHLTNEFGCLPFDNHFGFNMILLF